MANKKIEQESEFGKKSGKDMLFQGAELSMQNWIIFDEKICIVIVLWANRRTKTIIYTFISKLFLVLKWVFLFSSYKMLKTLLVFWVSPSFFLHRINDSLRPLEAKRKIERVMIQPACLLLLAFEVTLFKLFSLIWLSTIILIYLYF